MLVPSTDTTVEEDLPRLLVDHASVHFTRMSLPTVTPVGLAHMEDSARAAIQMLADIRPDVVLFVCTSGSFFQGAEHELELAADLSSIARAPVVTTARAMVEALARRGQRVRLRTPYSDELTVLEVAYLEHAGLTVTSSAGLGIVDDLEIAAIAADTLRTLVSGDDDADVVMLSCTNVRALDVLPMLRDAAGLDVVTSNLAGAEAVVRALDSRPGDTTGHRWTATNTDQCSPSTSSVLYSSRSALSRSTSWTRRGSVIWPLHRMTFGTSVGSTLEISSMKARTIALVGRCSSVSSSCHDCPVER